jgi:hypothetical protein
MAKEKFDIHGEEDMEKDSANPSDSKTGSVSGVSDEGKEAKLDHLPLKQSGKME